MLTNCDIYMYYNEMYHVRYTADTKRLNNLAVSFFV